MKKFVSKLVLVALLIGLTVYLYNTNSKSTIKEQLTDFAVKDTASITKIFMADKNNQQITLTKTGNIWMVDNEFKAKPDMMKTLLKTMLLLKVRSPVPKPMHNNVVKRLAASSIKIEIYNNDESTPSKVYFVGGPNADHTGTFMLLNNSSVPFVLHLEGHYGFLDTRYSTDKLAWRDNYIWQFPGESLKNIKQISVANHLIPKESFIINQTKENEYELTDFNGNIKPYDNGFLLNYIKQFENVAYEEYEEMKTAKYMDSLMTSTPKIFTLELSTMEGETTTISTWNKPLKDGAVDLVSDTPITNDVNRFYALINKKDIVIAQYYTFDALTLKASQFSAPQAIK